MQIINPLAKATSRNVNDFLFSTNKNWPLTKILVRTVQGNGGANGTQSATIISSNSLAGQDNPANSIISNVATDTLNTKALRAQQSSTTTSSNADTKTSIPNQPTDISRVDTQAIVKFPNISNPSEELIKTLAQETFIETKELIANAEKLQTIVQRSIKSLNGSGGANKEGMQSPIRSRTEQKNNNQIQPTQDKEKTSTNSIVENLGQNE